MNPNRLVYGIGAALLVAGGFVAAGLVFAQQPPPAPAPAQAQIVSVSADQARAAALAAVPGTVLELALDEEGGRVRYEVAIMPQGGGPVREVLVDASTGAVLSAMAADAEGADTDDAEGAGDDD